MTREKVFLAVIAILIGVLVASIAFYLYQSTKTLPPEKQKTVFLNPSPTPKPLVLLTVDEPQDEKIYDNKVIKVSGKTEPDAMIIILTEGNEQVLSPARDGSFSTTVTLESGANFIQITAVNKNGDTNTLEKTASYSSENF